ncbi:hypothetical protein [Paraburkholderia acidisoli]|uniref:Lipoprotein SmpA/OmlA domain-containing protein n=1 Tax=Paraburkholderia acidisoli TaxID=2571748 RepID=A0A7Z2GHI0_9BURK|nr:hypothetical protein [Paraburkholderia acidisoli]QGZ61559.1 hypothetical protein FAZ98_07320 [Paraburkholderia acidisoli]
MSKLPLCAFAAAALVSLAACGPTVKPDQVMASVLPGMTENEVYKRIGPPDREYVANGRDCFGYDLGNYGNVPFAVYFDNSHKVAGTVRGECKGRRR